MTPARRRLWIAALALWSVLIAGRLFYYHTPVWPDESTFGDTAYSLSRAEGFATPSLAGQVPGAERRLLWIPPVHTVMTAAVFRVTGPRVESMRAISIAAAFLAVIAAALLASHIGGGVAGLIAATVLLVDARFLRVALVGRMDILAIALTCLALWQAARAMSDRRAALFAGLFAGLAVSTHPAGLIAAGALLVELAISRMRGERMSAAAAILGFALGLLPLAALVALDPSLFLEQFASQMWRKQMFAGSRLLQMSWNLDPRPLAAGVIWIAIAAGVLTLARRWSTRAARLSAVAAVLALALNISGPEVMYVAWLIVPAAIGLGVLCAGANGSRPLARLARVAVIAFIGLNAMYMSARVVRARSLDYTAFADHVRRCAIDAAPDGTSMLINSLPDVYLRVIDQRGRLDFRLPAPVATAQARALVLSELEAVLFGPLAHDIGWTSAVDAERSQWQFVPLRPTGGYTATIAMRRGHEYRLPDRCTP